MLDRQKIETILSRRFPGAKHDQMAAAVNAIMGLGDEWEEMTAEIDLGGALREVDSGEEIRFFRRRAESVSA